MPTTLSTRTIQLSDGSRYRPEVWRMFALTSCTIGSTQDYKSNVGSARVARVHYDIRALTTNTTLVLTLATAPVSAMTVSNRRTVLTSSGAAEVRIATTGTGTVVFAGLNRWSEFKLVNATTTVGSAESTGIFIDAEFA